MVTQNSRRSFLFGRRAPPSAWGNFCSRLARTCQGSVRWSDDAASPEAWLVPARQGDLAHAQALCLEYGVRIMLEGLDKPALTEDATPLLWLEPSAAWATCLEETPEGKLIRADAGCSLSALQALGVPGLAGTPLNWSVAQWFASPEAARWPTGQVASSPVERVEVRLSDGTIEVLGPFGASAMTPLRSLTVQKMVPRFFELTGSEQAQACARMPVWPGRLRLDALMPAQGQETNLALLLAGHGGTLAWVQAVWFRKEVLPPDAGHGQPSEAAAQTPDVVAHAAWLDQQLKKTFDPVGLFPPIPQAKGIESAT